MSTTTITCPACGKTLEIDEESLGKEVECGECFEVFVAKESGGSIRGKPSRSGKSKEKAEKKPSRRRRRDDDDDDYDHDYEDDDDYRPRSRRVNRGPSAAAIVGLIFGILSIPMFCCTLFDLPFCIIAIVLGTISRKEPESAGLGMAAIITGSIGLFFAIGYTLLYFIGVMQGFIPWR